jgi:hypothetical protein
MSQAPNASFKANAALFARQICFAVPCVNSAENKIPGWFVHHGKSAKIIQRIAPARVA